MKLRRIALSIALSWALGSVALPAEDWSQWGGPSRDFRVSDPGLAWSWEEVGPVELWSRPLGEGYSAIAVVAGRLYTQYSEAEEVVVVALEAGSGEEIWSYRYVATRPEGMRLNYGAGPHASPLVEGGRVFVVGTTGRLLAFDAGSGELLWERDLWGEYGGFQLRRGYGASPIAWKGSVIVPVGGEAPGMMAFSQSDGSVSWQSEPFDSAQSSPVLMDVDGETQLIQFIQDEVVGLDPDDGALLWRHPHKVAGPYNVSTPVAGSDGTLFVSSSYGAGSRMLRLSKDGARTSVEELWHSKRMGIHFTNALRIDPVVFASTGRSGVFAAALDARSGELAWKSRAIARASYIQLGERFLALEADGRLMLGELSETGPEILAETQILDSQTWTVPTLAGSTLFVRDRERILAFALPLAAE